MTSRSKSPSVVPLLAAAFGLVAAHGLAAAQEPRPAGSDAQQQALARAAEELFQRSQDPGAPLGERAAAFLSWAKAQASEKGPADPATAGRATAGASSLTPAIRALPPSEAERGSEYQRMVVQALGYLVAIDPDAIVPQVAEILENQPAVTVPPVGLPGCEGASPYGLAGGYGAPTNYAPAGPLFAKYYFSEEYRIAAVEILGRARSPLAVNFLRNLLLQDRYPGVSPAEEAHLRAANAGVRAAAAGALGRIGSGAASAALAVAAESDPSPVVREAARAALAGPGQPGPAPMPRPIKP